MRNIQNISLYNIKSDSFINFHIVLDFHFFSDKNHLKDVIRNMVYCYYV